MFRFQLIKHIFLITKGCLICLKIVYCKKKLKRIYGWNQPGREKANKLEILPFTYWVLLTILFFFALLEIVMCLKHVEASHIMAFNS